MAEIVGERNEVAGIRIQAMRAGGERLDAVQAAQALAELFASDLEDALGADAPSRAASEAFHARVREVLARRLAALLVADAVGVPPPTTPESLPVAGLKPADVIAQGAVRLSLASLYRSVDANRFYCVKPPGQTNGRVFPAWQFVEPVPELLPSVLDALHASLPTETHAFLVTALDELNELSPAELLAGRPFAGRGTLHASQRRLLKLTATERQGRVLEVIERGGDSVAD